MSFRHLLSVLACGLALAACDSTVELPDDAEACAGYQCTAGKCMSSGGQPLCRCGAWEDAAGVPCAVGAFKTPDEFGGSPESAGVLTLPMAAGTAELQDGLRSELRDRDLFAFTAVPGHAYAFYCGLVTLNQCTLRLLNAWGYPVELSLGDRVNERQRVSYGLFRPKQEGPWYIEVSNDTYEGTYTYQLEDLGPDDHGDSNTTATPMEAFREPSPFPVTHSTPLDPDVFTFRAVEGHGYRFSCAHSAANYQSLWMAEAGGRVVDSLVKPELGRAAVFGEAQKTADWYVQTLAASHVFPLTSSCRLEDLGLDDHADSLDGATPVVPDAPVSVTFQSRTDADVLAFTSEPGHIYRLHADGAGSEECEVRVLNDQGSLLVVGSSRSLTFEPPEPGRYYVFLQRATVWMPTFLYTVEDLGLDDHGDTADTSTFVPWGTPISGRFETQADTDAIAFPAEAEHIYLVDCEPACDVARDWAVPSPAVLARFGPGRYLLHAPRTESLVLLLRPQSGSDSFTLRLQDVATDDHGDTNLDAEPLTLPATMSGVLQTLVDEDVFSVQLVFLRKYRLTTVVGPHQLMVTDTFGAPVFMQGGVFVAGRSGTYLIRVHGASGLSQSAWGFTLREE